MFAQLTVLVLAGRAGPLLAMDAAAWCPWCSASWPRASCSATPARAPSIRRGFGRGLRGANIAFLVAWVAVADSLTVVAMPLTLSSSGNVGIALAGDVAIVAAGALVLYGVTRIRPARWWRASSPAW